MYCLPFGAYAIPRYRLPKLALSTSSFGATRLSSASSPVGQTLVGRTGREYIRTERVQSDETQYQRSVYLAKCGDKTFVLKRVSDIVYQRCQQHISTFQGGQRLRLHIDENDKERTLIYDFLRGNLFQLMNAYNQQPDIDVISQIMWETGKAIQEMHDKKVMHIDLKPDNILLDWDDTAAGPPKITKVVVSDLDNAYDVKGWSMHPTAQDKDVRFGNIRWRAPEMQTGRGIGMYSDVFTYALIYLYTLIGQVPLGDTDYYETAKQVKLSAEELALITTIEFYGPLTPGFLRHTIDEDWQQTLKDLESRVIQTAGANPVNRFENWTVDDFPRLNPPLKEMLSKMLKLTPKERSTIGEVMKDPSWERGRGHRRIMDAVD